MSGTHEVSGVGASAGFDRVQVLGNGDNGIAITGGATATVRSSTVSANETAGFYVDSSGAPSQLVIVDSVSASNRTGIRAQLGGTVYISGVTIIGNNTGLKAVTGGSIYSYGDNRIDGNSTNGAPSSGVSTQ